jgi:acyl carrier protein
MEDQEILLKLNDVVSSILKRKVELNPASTAADVDGWDSLSHMMIINGVEKQFAVKFKLKEIMNFKNTGDLISCIRGKLAS